MTKKILAQQLHACKALPAAKCKSYIEEKTTKQVVRECGTMVHVQTPNSKTNSKLTLSCKGKNTRNNRRAIGSDVRKLLEVLLLGSSDQAHSFSDTPTNQSQRFASSKATFACMLNVDVLAKPLFRANTKLQLLSGHPPNVPKPVFVRRLVGRRTPRGRACHNSDARAIHSNPLFPHRGAQKQSPRARNVCQRVCTRRRDS